MRRLAWAPNARAELREAREYLRTIDPDLFGALVSKALTASRFLLEQPGAGVPIGRGSVRKWRVKGTPYLLLYRAEAEELRVLHFVHAARDWTNFL